MFEDQGHENDSYDVAQVCLKGHPITNMLVLHPEQGQKHCSNCGAATVSRCQKCERPIRGHYHNAGDSIRDQEDVPQFCHDCGAPYPWQAAKLEAAQAMVDELDELTGAERETLRKSIDQIATDGPMTEVAVTRFKKIMLKVGKETGGAMRRLAIDVAGKAAAELLKGGI